MFDDGCISNNFMDRIHYSGIKAQCNKKKYCLGKDCTAKRAFFPEERKMFTFRKSSSRRIATLFWKSQLIVIEDKDSVQPKAEVCSFVRADAGRARPRSPPAKLCFKRHNVY